MNGGAASLRTRRKNGSRPEARFSFHEGPSEPPFRTRSSGWPPASGSSVLRSARPAVPSCSFSRNPAFENCSMNRKCARHRNSGRFRQLRSVPVASTRRRQIDLRDAWRQENLEHPLIQGGKELRRRYPIRYRMSCYRSLGIESLQPVPIKRPHPLKIHRPDGDVRSILPCKLLNLRGNGVKLVPG